MAWLPGPLRKALEHWRESAQDRVSLDGLLAHADPREPFAARLRWLARLVSWIGRHQRPPAGAETARLPETPRPPEVARLRFALNTLDKHPEWKLGVARTLRATVRDIDALELYCESGLPQQPGFVGEAFERLLARILPRDPYSSDLGSVLRVLFPTREGARWLEGLDADTLERVAALAGHEEGPQEAGWNSLHDDIPDALLVLVSDLRALGLKAPIRRRLDGRPFRELPFFGLTRAAEEVLAALRDGERARLEGSSEALRLLLWECRSAVVQVRLHLDEHGVSLAVEYMLERMSSQIVRVESLLDLLASREPLPAVTLRFLVRLVEDSVRSTGIGSLLEQTTRLLAKKLVDRSAETGEHYIARTRREWLEMLRAASGGGAVTAITVVAKFLLTALHAAPFVIGLLASLNYAISFVAIQLLHFTLATKQPAMTAPALAAKLGGATTPDGASDFLDEAVHLIRTQIVGVLGNILLVVPATLAFVLPWHALTGQGFLGVEKAKATLDSFSLLGPSLVYAALTGVMLWLSSLIAGSADNWFALRRVGDGIARSPRLSLLLGRQRAERLARWLDLNVSGLAGNVSLGFLLGLSPSIFAFLGLPLDIRHVTLSSGALAAAVEALGLASLREPAFWLSALGVLAIGVVNVAVSFTLALALAMRSHGHERESLASLPGKLLARVVRRPGSILLPPSAGASPTGPSTAHQ
jgi:site-specific recombinase